MYRDQSLVRYLQYILDLTDLSGVDSTRSHVLPVFYNGEKVVEPRLVDVVGVRLAIDARAEVDLDLVLAYYVLDAGDETLERLDRDVWRQHIVRLRVGLLHLVGIADTLPKCLAVTATFARHRGRETMGGGNDYRMRVDCNGCHFRIKEGMSGSVGAG